MSMLISDVKKTLISRANKPLIFLKIISLDNFSIRKSNATDKAEIAQNPAFKLSTCVLGIFDSVCM